MIVVIAHNADCSLEYFFLKCEIDCCPGSETIYADKPVDACVFRAMNNTKSKVKMCSCVVCAVSKGE